MRKYSFALVFATVAWMCPTNSLIRASAQDPADSVRSADSAAVVAGRLEKALETLMMSTKVVSDMYAQTFRLDSTLGWIRVSDDHALVTMTIPKMELVMSSGTSFPRLKRIPPKLVDLFSPDWKGFDQSRYAFTDAGMEFVGELKCYVFDVEPRAGFSGFRGRIWIDDVDLEVVRYAGSNPSVDAGGSDLFGRKVTVHFEGWRANIRPHVWAPSLVFFEATPRDDHSIRIAAQVRVWNYANNASRGPQELIEIHVAEPAIDASADGEARQPTPGESEQLSEEAESRRLDDRLIKLGWMAPPGEVEQMCAAMANKMSVAAKLALPPIECRILLPTAPFGVIAVGSNRLYLWRSALDLPRNEASIAALAVAHGLAHHHVPGGSISARRLLAIESNNDLLKALQPEYNAQLEPKIDAMVVGILDKSVYRAELEPAAVLVDMAEAAAPKQLSALFGPFFLKHADSTGLFRASPLANRRFGDCGSARNRCAGPIGARLFIDARTNRLELLRARTEDSAGEKYSLSVTAFYPHLEHLPAPVARASGSDASAPMLPH